MMRMMSVMVISSSYFVEYLCQFRILPLTAPFAFFTLAFDLALRSFLSLETLFAHRVAYGLLDPLKHDTPLSLLSQDLLGLADLFLHFGGCKPTRYYGNACPPPRSIRDRDNNRLFQHQIILDGLDPLDTPGDFTCTII